MKRLRFVTTPCLDLGWLPLVVAAAVASPGPQQFFSCTDYHCDQGEMVTLTASQWQEVRDLFTPDVSPAQERENIRQAIALLESKVGAITGTWRDLAGNVAGAGKPGQLDCIAESKNTTSYLTLLFDDGLLKHHDIAARQVRRPWIFNVHWSAVIRESRTGQRFAVDSWFLDNGQPPRIQPLEEWLSGQSPE